MNNNFFKSERDKYVFCLTQLDGINRNKMIGLTEDLYDSLESANEWYEGILKILGPTDSIEISEAKDKLYNLYSVVLSSF